MVVQVLQWLLLVGEVCMAGAILYLCILSVSALFASRTRSNGREGDSAGSGSPRARFAILIPAHNEEDVIEGLLASLEKLDYPKDRYTVHVIADNCTDCTAELVRATGWARVHERLHELKRGKGYALHWGLHILEEQQLIYDAYIVLDADSVVEPAFLQKMASGLAKGYGALQANNTVLNVADSPSTALRMVALTLVNHLRPLGRNGLGASSTLTGNGMCLSRAILQRYPWQAFGVTEDYQYYLTLIQHGVRVFYVPTAVVRSHMPTTFRQMRAQDIRWESSSTVASNWRIALKLLRAGILARDLARIEAVVELLVPPLSFTVFACLALFIFSIIAWSLPALILGLFLLTGIAFYIGTGLYLLRPTRAIYQSLLHAPGFILWKLWVYVVARKGAKAEWVRTHRTISVKE